MCDWGRRDARALATKHCHSMNADGDLADYLLDALDTLARVEALVGEMEAAGDAGWSRKIRDALQGEGGKHE